MEKVPKEMLKLLWERGKKKQVSGGKEGKQSSYFQGIVWSKGKKMEEHL